MGKAWWRDELEQRESTHLRRRLRSVPPGVLDLASNDYLGLSRHTEVLRAAHEALDEFGAGARASRLVSGHFSIHEELERELAAFKNCEAALLFPSGYHANIAVVTSLASRSTLVCCDKRNHASLIDACMLAKARGAVVRFYDSLDKLHTLLHKNFPNILIVSDAVYSMDGDLAPIPKLIELCKEFDATLILDDAHGNGTLGQTGRGVLECFSASDCSSVIQTGTLSKALGAQGGFVCGDGELIEWLINAARPFVYTTGLNPAACGAALGSLRIIQREPERIARLQEIKSKLANGLSTLGFDAQLQPSPIIPILVGEADKTLSLSERLLQQKIWCPAIRPPTVPKNTSRLRVTANAGLTDNDVAQVLEAFSQSR